MTNDITSVQQNFVEIAEKCKSMSLIESAGKAFEIAVSINQLQHILTDDIMREYFMPLMNKRIGFMTDLPSKKNPSSYSVAEVRTCIIDALMKGLNPTGNQFNIIAGNMYPTKEGYHYLLQNIEGLKYSTTCGDPEKSTEGLVKIPVEVIYSYAGENKKASWSFLVKKGSYDSYDQSKGKAERKAN